VLKHRRDFAKVAMVGGPKWEEWRAKKAASPLMKCEIRTFRIDQLPEAWAWLGATLWVASRKLTAVPAGSAPCGRVPDQPDRLARGVPVVPVGHRAVLPKIRKSAQHPRCSSAASDEGNGNQTVAKSRHSHD
jgi:hypothetical protein